MRPPPVAIGLGGGLLLALLLAPATGTSLGALAKARAERAAQIADRDAPMPARAPRVAGAQLLRAADPAAARGALANRIRTQAARDGVLVEALAPVGAPPGLAVVRVRLSGPEKAVIALADRLERSAPVLRLRDWRVEPVDGGVRLTAEAVAPWQ